MRRILIFFVLMVYSTSLLGDPGTVSIPLNTMMVGKHSALLTSALDKARSNMTDAFEIAFASKGSKQFRLHRAKIMNRVAAQVMAILIIKMMLERYQSNEQELMEQLQSIGNWSFKSYIISNGYEKAVSMADNFLKNTLTTLASSLDDVAANHLLKFMKVLTGEPISNVLSGMLFELGAPIAYNLSNGIPIPPEIKENLKLDAMDVVESSIMAITVSGGFYIVASLATGGVVALAIPTSSVLYHTLSFLGYNIRYDVFNGDKDRLKMLNIIKMRKREMEENAISSKRVQFLSSVDDYIKDNMDYLDSIVLQQAIESIINDKRKEKSKKLDFDLRDPFNPITKVLTSVPELSDYENLSSVIDEIGRLKDIRKKHMDQMKEELSYVQLLMRHQNDKEAVGVKKLLNVKLTTFEKISSNDNQIARLRMMLHLKIMVDYNETGDPQYEALMEKLLSTMVVGESLD